MYFEFVIVIFGLFDMLSIQAYDIKARKKVSMINPKPYLMKNGMWTVK